MKDANKWYNDLSDESKEAWHRSECKRKEKLNNMTSTEAMIYWGLV